MDYLSTDAYMIILLRTLAINDKDLLQGASYKIICKQEKNGEWKLFYDEMQLSTDWNPIKIMGKLIIRSLVD
jgi:hypothetical protein